MVPGRRNGTGNHFLLREPFPPLTRELQQQKQQNCLNGFNNSPDGEFYNFMSMTSPIIGPEPVTSLIEDTAGIAAKYGALKYLQAMSTAYDPLVAGAEWAAKEVVLPVSIAATVGQVTGHIGCYTASQF
jgi:hypothetical protein